MWTNERVLSNKKPNFEKLIEYGFIKCQDVYVFSTDITDSMFCYNIYVSKNSTTKSKVIDKATNEEYTLVTNENAVGSFVARVRTECEDILTRIVSKCYDDDLFKGDYSKLVAEYIVNKYSVKPEYLWEKTPNNCIFRNSKTNKWFVVFLLLEKRKLGINEDGKVEIINLKEVPENITELIDNKKYFFGFHMNKKHWYTICLDGSVPIKEIYERIDKSFALIKK